SPSGSASPVASSTPSPKTTPTPADARYDLVDSHGLEMVPFRGVVFSEALAKEIAPAVLAADSYWRPTRDDLIEPVQNLVGYLLSNASKDHPGLAPKMKTYKSQFIGYLKGGKQKLYMNFFCSEESGWETRLVMVKDGGECYFHVTYDVASKTFSD